MRYTWLRRPLDFILFSNLFIACCAMAQGALTYMLLKAPLDFTVIAILGCATLFLYNFSMILARPKDPASSPHRRVHWIYAHYKLVVTLTVLSAITLIPLTLQLSIGTITLLFFIGLLALSYSFPLFKDKTKRVGLRNLPGAKLFIISMVWALSCVCVPIIELKSSGTSVSLIALLLLTTKRFLFVTAITIPFDIRDLFQDKQYNLKTLPVILGEKKSALFCQALLIVYIVLLLIFVPQLTLAIAGLIAVTLLTGWLIFKSRWEKDEYYYFFYLDGTLILQFLSVFILQYFSVGF
ncbi:UbiA family prenyltransferase [Albibacterium sp.]|uniref:UbiA family prenyltransferase n=1 Tax=Albibacterium sp. TaxID=2952885 RepID=UPI002C13101F|nr:UbiA family prenyltransferase [Albibacterium sp.]HUH18047.1 UbiA family prenyltransferase [Albibacterium sp.]